jgi:hypothetical protein
MGTRVYDTLVIAALSELADAELRSRLWLSDGSTDVSSLDECACSLYDDSGLGDALDRESPAVYDMATDADLRSLRRMLRLVDRDRAVTDVLADPVIHEAGDIAARLLPRVRSADPRE